MLRYLIPLALLTSACAFDPGGAPFAGDDTTDGGDSGDGSTVDGAAPDAPSPDATAEPDAEPDAAAPECEWDIDCPQDINPCTTGRCVNGTCEVGFNDGLQCYDEVAADQGRCRAGSCCAGCWDGQTCHVGTAVAACGSEGRMCLDCVDDNWCTDDVCNASITTCSNPRRPTDSACPDGSCNNVGVCEPDEPYECGGAGQDCCAGATCNEAGYTCGPVSGTCEPCGGQNELCCYPGEFCEENLICLADEPGGARCRCGGPDEPCCRNGPIESCDTGLLCEGPQSDRRCD